VASWCTVTKVQAASSKFAGIVAAIKSAHQHPMAVYSFLTYVNCDYDHVIEAIFHRFGKFVALKLPEITLSITFIIFYFNDKLGIHGGKTMNGLHLLLARFFSHCT